MVSRMSPDIKLEALLKNTWPVVAQLTQLAAQNNLPLMLVGGLVRDALHASQGPAAHGNDIDLVVQGDARLFCEQAVHAFGGAVVMAENPFLTCRWRAPEGSLVDVATARTEHYATMGALPNVSPAKLSDDLMRRDFTINAMAVDLRPHRLGQLIDPLDGQQDIRAKKVRILHPNSFLDDATRLFRAARFAARLDFTLETQTQVAAKDAMQKKALASLSSARIGEQWQKVFEEQNPTQAVRALERYGILEGLGFSLHARTQLRDLVHNIVSLPNEQALGHADLKKQTRCQLCWMALSVASDASLWPTALGWSRIDKTTSKHFEGAPACFAAVQNAFAQPKLTVLYRVLARLTPVQHQWAMALVSPQQHTRLAWWQKVGQHIQTPVDGQSLKKMGYVPGPLFAPAIAAALDAARLGCDHASQRSAAVAILEGKTPAVSAVSD